MKKVLEFIVDIGSTAAIFSIFFFEDNKYVNLMALIILAASAYGLLAAVLAPMKSLSGKGFLWKYYFSSVVRILILYQTKFHIIAKIYLLSAVFVLLKNLLALRVYNDQTIYIVRKD